MAALNSGSSANCVLTEGKIDFREVSNAEVELWFEPPQAMNRFMFGPGGRGRSQERYFSERKVITASSGPSSGDQGRNEISAGGRAKRVMPDSSLSGVDRSGTDGPQTPRILYKTGHKHTICGRTQETGQIIIVETLKNGASDKAGLLANDEIVQINSTKTEGMDLKAAVDLLRGDPGTIVKLTIRREAVTAPILVDVTRELVRLPNAK